MAIQPIDLQTLYTQIDKVAKNQVQQQHAVQLAREAEIQQNLKNTELKQKTVQELPVGEQNTIAIHDKETNETEQQDQQKQQHKEDKQIIAKEEDKTETIRDPHLGNFVDISG